MAQIPTPRSFNQVLGDMVDVFLSKLGLRKIKVGSPVLSIFEAAAMSDLRSSQAIFELLNSQDLERAQGVALTRIGESEDLPRLQETMASGVVTVQDSRITKISTKVYQGLAAPIVGSTTLYVSDASEWPATGSVYIGRGTPNYEGPLAYSSAVNSGTYWTVTLTTGTTKFHNLGESVVLAQNGNRTIGAGAVVQTPQGNVADAVQFTTLYPATILDGEVEVGGVVVVAKKPGVVGNVPAGAISSFASAPFSGATVSNPSPLSNGRATESDNDYRERIKNERASRALATPLAIKTKVLGITSPDEAKRVTSASVVRRNNYPTTLYLDDGTGYEEKSEGIAIETLYDLALGGEKYVQLDRWPVAKAHVTTAAVAPFALQDSAKLSVKVGGVPYEHVFLVGEFRSIDNATAYEVVASINADSSIEFAARTSDGGTKVVLFAKGDENEDIEVVAPDSGVDSNEVLLFPAGRVDTLRLYKNDLLLSKDGTLAVIKSEPSNLWNTFSGTETLTVAVDGTAAVTYSFTGQDFIDANTGFTSMGVNTPEAWAAVLNYRVPGIAAVAASGALTLTSNAGRVSRAKLDITGGTLVAKGMFTAQTVLGAARDYTLDRNVGKITLEAPLEANDRLAAGTVHTRGFLESDDISPVDITGAGANLFVAVDGSAEVIVDPNTIYTTIDITKPSTGAWGAIYRLTATSGTPFTNVQVGDWLLIWEPGASWTLLNGMWRVCGSGAAYVELQYADVGGIVAAGVATTGALSVVRYSGQMQKLTVPAATNYVAETFADSINSLVRGAEAYTHITNRLRIRTNSYADGGDIAVVSTDTEGAKLLLPTGDAVENRDAHQGSVESGNAEIGTPDFTDLSVASSSGATQVSVAGTVKSDRIVAGLKDTSGTRFGNNKSFWSPITSFVAGVPNNLTLRRSVPQLWSPEDRIVLASPYAIGPHDDITIVADGDTDTKRFAVPMWRALRPVGGTYGATNTFKDIGDGSATPSYLAAAFGKDFDFNDAVIYMRARAKSHGADATKSTLWRSKEFGLGGNSTRVAHVYPAAPSMPVSVSVESMPSSAPDKAHALVSLASDVKKTGYTLRNSTQIGYGYNDTIPAIPAVTLCIGFPVASAQRTANVTTLTLTLPSGLYAVTSHGIANGSVFWLQSTSGSFPSGLKTITAVAATTISYADVGADAGPIASIGTVSLDPTGEALFTGASPSPIAAGDIIRLENFSGIPADFRSQTIRISNVGPQFIQGYAERALGATSNQTLSFQTVSAASQVVIYGLIAASCTATAIAASVNALTAKCPVTATVLGTGAGQVLLSTRDELLVADAYYDLADGQNWVKTTVNPPDLVTDYQLTFKDGVTADLVSGADWANEEVRIAPITAESIANWMAVPALSGLFTSCSILTAAESKKVQLASLTTGSDGSVQVQGGTANQASATVVGTASSAGSYFTATVKASEALGFAAGQWVALDNTLPLQKTDVFTAATTLTSIDAAGVFTVGAAPIYTEHVADAMVDQTVSVEKQGRFVAYTNTGAAVASEGDWVYIKAPTTPGSDISSVNTGIFRVVRVSTTTIWIENANADEETGVKCDMRFFTADSLMPGDTISISTNVWGEENMGAWTVAHVGTGSTLFNSSSVFRVSITDKVTTAQGAVGALGATEVKKVLAIEGTPTRLIKRIHAVIPNQSDVTLSDVKFDTFERYTSVAAAAGTVMTGLDKLAFPTETSQGVNGYGYNTGLIGEAGRVIYGDEHDPATYGGVAAAGDTINIVGPLIKRVQVSLGIRAKYGISTTDIADQVKSAVAAVINKTGVGQAIAISDLVAAAMRVNGVVAVTVLSPTYGVGNDLISTQPFEKALVLNVDQDVLVSFVGE